MFHDFMYYLSEAQFEQFWGNVGNSSNGQLIRILRRTFVKFVKKNTIRICQVMPET